LSVCGKSWYLDNFHIELIGVMLTIEIAFKKGWKKSLISWNVAILY
jgi:hypothetical protein